MPIDHFDARVATIALYQERLYYTRTSLDEGFSLLRPSQLNIRDLKARRFKKQNRRPRLAYLLFYQHQFDYNHFSIAANNPRDLIFLALDVVANTMSQPGGPMLTIKVNYHRPSKVVFIEATKSFLKSYE